MTPLQIAIKLAKKFVKKVETGQARSRETYQDCLDFLKATESPEPTRCPGREDEIHNHTMHILGYFRYKDTNEPCCYLCFIDAKLDFLKPWYHDNFHSPHTSMCIMEASQFGSPKGASDE